ncbi:amidohydrolase family protein [Pseudonocardia sp. RS010]|uniref:amidohydrolase family protein n=1 Tax=Pseudonocardia sp. RS010 TaxID=3385979 RepID=UPI0039A13034
MAAPAYRKNGLLVVDSDTHLSEPWDLWTSRAPASIRDRVPQVKKVDGQAMWMFDDKPVGPAGAVCVVDKDMEKHYGVDYLFNMHVDEIADAASQIAPRLKLMDDQGIWAHLVYPNTVGFGGQQIGQIGDEKLRHTVVQIYNDAMAEMQAESGQRLFPMAIMPWWDRELMIKEIHRVKEIGLVGVNTVADPQEYGMPDLSEPFWAPMYDALVENGLPLNFHIGASATQQNYHGTAPWPSRNADEKLAIGSAILYMSNARILANFIYGGILERHPDLKVISVESGVGWVPFFLQALEYHYSDFLGIHPASSGSPMSLTPLEYFQRQCGSCFWFEDALLVEAVRYLGADTVMFESDFPHPTCLYPSPVERALKVFEGESQETKEKVFGGTAARLYHLPLPD